MRNVGNLKRRRRNISFWGIVLIHTMYGAPPAPQFYTDPLNDVYTDTGGQGYTD